MENCVSLADEGLWDLGKCCISCHEDADELGYDLVEVRLPDGREAYLCCVAARHFEEEGKRRRENESVRSATG